MPVKMNEREYRRIDVHDLEVRSEQDGEMIVEGYATTFGKEYQLFDMGDYRVLESIDRHAFDEADMSDVIMQYDHQGRVFARLSNHTLQLDADDHGLHIRADLGGTELGRQLYEEIKGGYTDKMSFGFTVAEDAQTVEEDKTNNRTTVHRVITRIKKLFDVSAVSLPANDTTEIYSARSYAEGVIDELRRESAAKAERERNLQLIKILLEV